MCLRKRASAYVRSGDEALVYIKAELVKQKTLTREDESKLIAKVQRKFSLSEGASAELLTTALDD